MPTSFQRCRRKEEPNSFCEAELAFVALLMQRAGVDMHVEFNEEEQGNYYLAAGKYFRASWQELQAIRAAGIPVHEIPVVLHVARHSGVAVVDVADLRAGGESWTGILSRYFVDRRTFYVALTTGIGQAPVHVPKFYRDTAVEAWKPSEFTDKDIINLANLKFAAEYYRLKPDTLVALLASGWTIANIHGELQSDDLVWDMPRSTKRFRRAG